MNVTRCLLTNFEKKVRKTAPLEKRLVWQTGFCRFSNDCIHRASLTSALKGVDGRHAAGIFPTSRLSRDHVRVESASVQSPQSLL